MKCGMDAVAILRGGKDHPQLRGEVRFTPVPEGTLVSVDIRGLPASDTGFFALHIHEGGDCGGEKFANTRGHFNPTGAMHPNHAGDLPPLLCSGGRACMCVVTDRFRVRDIVGKTMVIHAQPDDFRSHPGGNAGEKIACGVIRAIK